MAAAAGPAPVLSGSLGDDPTDGGEPAAGSHGATTEAAAVGVARFDAALRLVAGGQLAAAAEALAQLAAELPQDEIAPEALFEAGLLYEDQLAAPESAQRCFRQLVDRYRHTRLLRRAQQHLGQLDAALRTGAAPLVEFQRIVRSTSEGSGERQQRLESLLRSYPDFALADQSLFLLADSLLRAGQRSAAERQLEVLYQRFPRSGWAAQGHRLHGELLLASRRVAAARLQYQLLSRFPDPLWPLIAAEGLTACRQAERRLYLAIAGWTYLGLVALLTLWRSRRQLWPPPLEFWYYAPLAGLLSLSGLLVQGGQVATPIGILGLGGAVIVWLSAASARRRTAQPLSPSAARRIGGLLLGLFGRTVAVLLLCFLVIYHYSLIELIAETLRNGPDT